MAVTIGDVDLYRHTSPDFAEYAKYVVDDEENTRAFAMAVMYRKQIWETVRDLRRRDVPPVVFFPSRIVGKDATGEVMGVQYRGANVDDVIVGWVVEKP